MKSLFQNLLPFLVPLVLLRHAEPKIDPSPLAAFSSQWNDPKFLKCNTAANITYLSDEEKKTDLYPQPPACRSEIICQHCRRKIS